MPTVPDFDNIHVAQFTDNVKLLSQQMESRFAGKTDTMNAKGEQAQSVIHLSEQDPTELGAPTYNGGSYDGWYGDTVWDSIEHTQRWVMPTVWKRSLPISEHDTVRMLTDPSSRYPRAIVAGFNRKDDEVIINAALGNAKTGPYDNLADSALPAGQKIVPASQTVATDLSVDLLIDTWDKLHAAEANEMGEEIFFATTTRGLASLLRDEKLTSSDYAAVKALVAGQVDTFMGFKFIRTEGIPSIVNAGAGNFDFSRNFAFVKSGLMAANWNNLNIRVDPRPDKNYATQIYATRTCGAVRTEDVKVVEVNTTIPGTAT